MAYKLSKQKQIFDVFINGHTQYCPLCSPVIIADDANIEIAAERVMWTKLICCGQMCLSPDYVLCTSVTRDRFANACKKAITELYGEVKT